MREHGIRCTNICPGGVATDFALDEGRGRTPDALPRMMTAEDVAEVVVFALERPRHLRTTARGLYEHVTRAVCVVYGIDPRCDAQPTPVPWRKSMKRFTLLALIVLALAIVPAAFADDTTPAPTQPTAAPATTQTPAQQNAGRPGIQMRIEILRLRMQIVQLRFRLHCGQNGNASHERCAAFAQKVVDHLTKLDGRVQAKLAELKACTPDSTDPKCNNADKKIAVLTRVDTHLQNVIQKLQDWLNGKSPSDSALDQAANSLSQAATGSNG